MKTKETQEKRKIFIPELSFPYLENIKLEVGSPYFHQYLLGLNTNDGNGIGFGLYCNLSTHLGGGGTWAGPDYAQVDINVNLYSIPIEKVSQAHSSLKEVFNKIEKKDRNEVCEEHIQNNPQFYPEISESIRFNTFRGIGGFNIKRIVDSVEKKGGNFYHPPNILVEEKDWIGAIVRTADLGLNTVREILNAHEIDPNELKFAEEEGIKRLYERRKGYDKSFYENYLVLARELENLLEGKVSVDLEDKYRVKYDALTGRLAELQNENDSLKNAKFSLDRENKFLRNPSKITLLKKLVGIKDETNK